MSSTGGPDTPRPLVAGNWKMNGLQASLEQLRHLTAALRPDLGCDVMVCPPATLLTAAVAASRGSVLRIGGQDCHPMASGAHTGDLSAEMLADAGASAVIVGHSERRTDHGESDETIARKAVAAARAGLTAIICVGETAEQRKLGLALSTVRSQLANSVPDAASPGTVIIAYEPVWAIGTGLTPTPADVAEVHSAIRSELLTRYGAAGRLFRLLYGGSVKAQNAGELLRIANVDGALVGGASLKAQDFLGILAVYQA